jgi:hypothetical protein
VPDPDEPEVMVSHGALLAAVHVHPLLATIPILPVPPVEVNTWLVGEME